MHWQCVIATSSNLQVKLDPVFTNRQSSNNNTGRAFLAKNTALERFGTEDHMLMYTKKGIAAKSIIYAILQK